jgi:hypothetical protein
MEYGLLTFIIVLVALGAFWFAGRVEERFSKKSA